MFAKPCACGHYAEDHKPNPFSGLANCDYCECEIFLGKRRDPEDGSVWTDLRENKRYRVIGTAVGRSKKGSADNLEGYEMVVYCCLETNRLFVSLRGEFLDGRLWRVFEGAA